MENKEIETSWKEINSKDQAREQSWDRWLSASHNGVAQSKAILLQLFRNIAAAMTEQDYEDTKNVLLASEFWTENKRLQTWFENTWLKKHKRWVKAYRQCVFNVLVNTNNGVERQNKALKYEYLDMKKTKSLSQLLSTIHTKFFPDSNVKYLRMNVAASELARGYGESIPEFLKNRPRPIIEHCFPRWEDSANIPAEDVDDLGGGIFLVKSQQGSQQSLQLTYRVEFGQSDLDMPQCDCMDWKRSHLVCKHFMAVFRYTDFSWNRLPDVYKQNPILNLDLEHINVGSNNPIIPSTGPDTVDEIDNINDCDLHVYNEDTISELPVSSAAQIKRQRSRIVSLCQVMREWVYHSSDSNVLASVENDLSALISTVKASVPKDGQFIVDSNPMTHIRTASKEKACRKTSKKLPSRSRKKKGSGRVGVQAESTRRMQTRKGALQLCSENSTDQRIIEEGVGNICEMHVDESTQDSCSLAKKKKNVTFCDPIEAVATVHPGNQQRNEISLQVHGYAINQQSLDDLDSELPDEVVDAYLTIKTNEIEDRNVGVISSSNLTSIFCELIDPMDPFPSHGYLNKIHLEEYEILLGALCENNNHWCLMVVYPQIRQLLYMNPLGEQNGRTEQYLQNWLLFLSERSTRGIERNLSLEWNITTKRHRKQLDSTSCGLFTLKFAEQVLSNGNFMFDSSKRTMKAFRHVIAQILFDNSDRARLTGSSNEGNSTELGPVQPTSQTSTAPSKPSTSSSNEGNNSTELRHVRPTSQTSTAPSKPSTSSSKEENNSTELRHVRPTSQKTTAPSKPSTSSSNEGINSTELRHIRPTSQKTTGPSKPNTSSSNEGNNSTKLRHVQPKSQKTSAPSKPSTSSSNEVNNSTELRHVRPLSQTSTAPSKPSTSSSNEGNNSTELRRVRPTSQKTTAPSKPNTSSSNEGNNSTKLRHVRPTSQTSTAPSKPNTSSSNEGNNSIKLRHVRPTSQTSTAPSKPSTSSSNEGNNSTELRHVRPTSQKITGPSKPNTSSSNEGNNSTELRRVRPTSQTSTAPSKPNTSSSNEGNNSTKLRHVQSASQTTTALPSFTEQFSNKDQEIITEKVAEQAKHQMSNNPQGPRLRKPRVIKTVVDRNTIETEVHWLYSAVSAKACQFCQNVTAALCNVFHGMPLSIAKGFSIINGQNLATMFDLHVKHKLVEILEMTDGSARFYSAHWRHIRWVKGITLSAQLEMRQNKTGMTERMNIFGNTAGRELYAIVLAEFAEWKLKTKRRLGNTHKHYLSIKDSVKNTELHASLDSMMSQNNNTGERYLRDVLFVEAEILIVSHIKKIGISDADKLIYPMPK